jgi:rhodanese-related sulfurtransferase
MPAEIDTPEARRLHEKGALFIEVLPADSYRTRHIAGAISIPLDDLTAERVASLDRRSPTVTYCFDYQCDLSARAAARLSHLGFSEVYDYAPSKEAWAAAALPLEGSSDREVHARDLARTDVPTCTPEEPVGALTDRMHGWPVCVVVDDRRVVLGALRPEALALAAQTPAGNALHAAPPTVRPSMPARELRRSMERDGQEHVLVSTYGGVLIGLVCAEDFLVRR